MVYIDDLLCYSPQLEQRLRDVREVLAILRQEKLCLKASKCAFGRDELGFLGRRASAGVAVDLAAAAAAIAAQLYALSTAVNTFLSGGKDGKVLQTL